MLERETLGRWQKIEVYFHLLPSRGQRYLDTTSQHNTCHASSREAFELADLRHASSYVNVSSHALW